MKKICRVTKAPKISHRIQNQRQFENNLQPSQTGTKLYEENDFTLLDMVVGLGLKFFCYLSKTIKFIL